MKKYQILSAMLGGMLMLSGANLLNVSAEEVAYGDMNLDGEINVTDIVLMNRYLHNQKTITKEQFFAGDINQDGKVNVFDWVCLKEKLIRKNQEPQEPAQEEVYIGCIEHLTNGVDYDWDKYQGRAGVEVIKSKEELYAHKDMLTEKMQERYTDEYFEEHDLIAIFQLEGSLGYEHYVTGIETGENWTISVVRYSGNNVLCDAEQASALLIETDKSPESAKSITVHEQNDHGAQYIRTDGFNREWTHEPETIVITSRQELEEYAASEGNLLENYSRYYYNDSEFFKEHNLVFTVVIEGSGSRRHVVTECSQDEDDLHIEIKRLPLIIGTCDMAEWHIGIATDKSITRDTKITANVSGMDDLYNSTLYDEVYW